MTSHPEYSECMAAQWERLFFAAAYARSVPFILFKRIASKTESLPFALAKERDFSRIGRPRYKQVVELTESDIPGASLAEPVQRNKNPNIYEK